MKELTLFDPGPQVPADLTDVQSEALKHVRAAGRDGLNATELGRAMGSGEMYARSNGQQLLQALKKKRWVTQRRNGLYVAVDAPTGDAFGEIPY